MEKNNKIQPLTSSSPVQASTPEAIASIRLDVATYPRYGKISVAARQEWLAKEIKALASVVRIKDFDGREAVFMAGVLDGMLSDSDLMSDLTFPEMHEAFMCGVFGKYGEFFGISAPNLYGFVESYLDSEKKLAASKIVREANEKKRIAEREAELRKMREEVEEAKRKGEYTPGEIFNHISLKSALQSVGSIEAKDAAHRERVRRQAMEIIKEAENGLDGR